MIKLIIKRKTMLNEAILNDIKEKNKDSFLNSAIYYLIKNSPDALKKSIAQISSPEELISVITRAKAEYDNHIANKSSKDEIGISWKDAMSLARTVSNAVSGDARNIEKSKSNKELNKRKQQNMSNDFSFDPNEQISPNFKLREFRSTDSRYKEGEEDKLPPKEFLPRIKLLAKNLEVIRAEFNRPVRIISGYRSPYKNKKVDGAKDSQHMQGRAADIMIKGVSSLDVFLGVVRLVKAGKIQIGGIGLYPKFVHIDVRPTGKIAVWKDDSLSDEYLKQYVINSKILKKQRNPRNSMIATLDTLTNKVDNNTGEASESGVA